MLSWVEAIAPYGIFTTDADAGLHIRTWNQWLVTHSGLTAEEVIGRPLIEVYPEVAERKLDVHFRRALDGEVSVLSTALHRHLLPLPSTVRTGTAMLQTARIAPLVFGDAIVGTITTIEDVTQRESHSLVLRRQQEYDRLLSSTLALLLASEDPLQAATEMFPKIAAPLKVEVYFCFRLSPDGTELHLQTAGGITADVRKSMTVLKLGEGLCGGAASARAPARLSCIQESTAAEAQIARRMGLRSYAVFPLMVGERLLGILSFGSYGRDEMAADELEFLGTVAQYLAIATERALREKALREAQASLSEHAETLEAKIAERTARLHETIVQLESFSYTVAHDLRAPIRSLKGFSEILLSDYAPDLPEEAGSMLRRLLRASNRLDALTRDLLQFSRVVRQDVKLAPVDVAELVHEIEAVTPALQHGVLAVAPALGLVQAQRTLLQQCLSNLLDNALKFIAPGVTPRIIIRSEFRDVELPPATSPTGAPFQPSITERDAAASPEAPRSPAASPARRVRIWVEDNGIGIAPQQHEKIFGIFERVSGLEHVEGTGIGLAIVARAMQQMRGACGVESELGRGSRFWLELAAAD